MPSRDTTESPFRRGVTPSNKRKFRETYDPSINEQFPQDPWHTLNHESIIDQVGELCDELTIPLEKYVGIDEAIENLKKQAEDARKLPDMKKLRVAVLGEQGVGKSTLVNALLDRKILDNSAGSTACTAYATTIEYKPGVADNTQVSDVKIEFFSEEEIDAFVKDQHNRWADCYPGPQARRRDLAQDSDESSSDEFSSEGSTPVAATDAEKEKLKNSAKTRNGSRTSSRKRTLEKVTSANAVYCRPGSNCTKPLPNSKPRMALSCSRMSRTRSWDRSKIL
jgi:hypothetical protein